MTQGESRTTDACKWEGLLRLSWNFLSRQKFCFDLIFVKDVADMATSEMDACDNFWQTFLEKLLRASLKYILLRLKMSSIYLLPAVWTWGCFCLRHSMKWLLRGQSVSLTGRGSGGGGSGQGAAPQQAMGASSSLTSHRKQLLGGGWRQFSYHSVSGQHHGWEDKEPPLISFQSLVF